MIASRRVGEAFNIYAPDKETVICSLTVKRVSSRHDVKRELTGAWANLEVLEDKEKCVLHVTERDGDTVKIRAGDKLKLFDKDKKGVICEILVTEIREHLKTPTPERFLALLDRQKAELENRMKKLEHTLEYIDYKRKVTEEGIHAPLRKVVFEQLRDEYLITTDYSGEDDARSIQTAVAKHFRFCREIGLTEQKAIGAIIPVDSVTEDSYHYSKFYTLVDPNEVAPTAGTEPIVDSGGSYIAVYDNKGYENICELCHLLLDYAKKNHLWLDDSFYEDVILDDFSVPGYYNYLVKVSIRVR